MSISGPFNLPDVTIKRISNLKEVPVPTLEVKVNSNFVVAVFCLFVCLVDCFRFDFCHITNGKLTVRSDSWTDRFLMLTRQLVGS